MLHHRIRNSPPPVPLLSQINPFHVPSELPKININTIPSSTPGSSKWSLSLKFVYLNHVCTSLLSHTCYVPRPSHSSLKFPQVCPPKPCMHLPSIRTTCPAHLILLSSSPKFVHLNHVCTSLISHTCYVPRPSHSSLKSVIRS
jgi:hypothetical protein